MENQILFYKITESIEVSARKIKSLIWEGREALGVAIAERQVKGARWGQHQCLRAPRVAVRNFWNVGHVSQV